MGGVPAFALNILGFPSRRLPLWVLDEILRGAEDKAREAGVAILGGHSIDDLEPKYGMSVSGFVHPKRILTNKGAQIGDVLILTKAIGTGILSTAMKRNLASQEATEAAIRSMSSLNAKASSIIISTQDMFPLSIHACTDVTGFGLLGHLKGITISSEVDCEIYAETVPLLPQVYSLCCANVVPGGTKNNFKYVQEVVS